MGSIKETKGLKANALGSFDADGDALDAPVSAALASEMKAFCIAHSLTPRESDILSSLVEGVVRIKDIAVRMGLSPNTVNNHVNSIFVKTKARSKSQLLSYLLTYVSEELQAARALRRKPKVAIVDADSREAEALAQTLAPLGFETATFVCKFPMQTWPDGLAAYAPEFIVVDHVSISSPDIQRLIEAAKNSWQSQVLFCGQSESGLARRSAMAAGAIDWVARPSDCAKLAQTLMAHAIRVESDSLARARAVVLEKRVAGFKKARELVTITRENLGSGGIFLSTETLRRAIESSVEPGDWVELKFTMESHAQPVAARGQVVWHAAEGEGAGAGVRFSYLDIGTQAWMSQFVRDQGIKCYIPGGTNLIR